MATKTQTDYNLAFDIAAEHSAKVVDMVEQAKRLLGPDHPATEALVLEGVAAWHERYAALTERDCSIRDHAMPCEQCDAVRENARVARAAVTNH